MISGRLGVDLEETWAKDDPSVAHRWAWPVWAGNGAENTATCYFEIDAGKRIGAHVHDCDETIVLLEGSGRGRVGDEWQEVEAGAVVHAPEGVTHDFVNTGENTMKLIGFFSKAEVDSTYEMVLNDGTTGSGTP